MSQEYDAVPSIKRTDRHLIIDIQEGGEPGYRVFNKFGYNPAIGLGFEDVWAVGGVKTYVSVAATGSIVSDDAADAAAGTGARTIKIFGIDGDYHEQSETITMNGTTPVSTVNSYLRIYRAFVTTAGSGLTNAGDITISISGNTEGNILAGDAQTLMCQYTIPEGFTGYLWAINATQSTAGSALEHRFETTLGTNGVFRVRKFNFQDFDHNQQAFEVIEEKSDIRIRTQKPSGGSPVGCSAEYHLILVKYA